MNLTWFDWGIIFFAVVALRFVSVRARSHMKGVADFLSANRSAGRYLLTIASSMGGVGTISFVALFEMYYVAGFPPIWWALLSAPVGCIICLTGWVYWRFRETRAMTLAQFLEMRYGRRYRIFSGIIIWACGVVNFGIFPAVASRFIMYFCGLPEFFHIPGIPFEFSTFIVIMLADLGLALMFVNMGGQISVMVTECVQGIVTGFAFLLIIVAIVVKLNWSQIVTALNMAPANASMLNPYHTTQVPDFNIWFFMIGLFWAFYGQLSWQGTSGFMSSGRNPHEQRMAGVISIWRYMPQMLFSILLPLAAYTIMKAPEFTGQAVTIQQSLDSISNATLRTQMTVPVALAFFLPVGIKGLLAMCMIFFSFTCHDTYMHSWGTIFVQDVLLPFRQARGKPPLSPDAHIRWLRWSIVFVAAFAFFFSAFYVPTQKIFMFFAITGTIWAGGSGAVVIGGLYWRRGSTAGAYAAVSLGAALGLWGIFSDKVWQALYGHNFPINGQYLWGIAMASAIVVYVVVSLCVSRGRKAFNLEKMLYHGPYADEKSPARLPTTLRNVLGSLLGITPEFTVMDRVLATFLVVWNFGWLATFVIVSAIQFKFGLSDAWWAGFWHVYLVALFCLGAPATLWLAIGGIRDIRALFKSLDASVRNPADNGRVADEDSPFAPSHIETPTDALSEGALLNRPQERTE